MYSSESLRRLSLPGEKSEDRLPPPATPEHADVRGIAPQDGPEDGNVVLVVVRHEHHQRAAPDRRRGGDFRWNADDDLVGVGEPVAAGEARAPIDHDGPESEPPGKAHQRNRDIPGTEDEERRRRTVHLEERERRIGPVAQWDGPRYAAPGELPRSAARPLVERRIAEGAERRSVTADHEPLGATVEQLHADRRSPALLDFATKLVVGANDRLP